MSNDTLFLLAKQGKFKPVDNSSRLYRKELIYEGTFEKDEEFSVGKPDFAMWLSNFKKFVAAGNEVPLQLEHDESPESTRGKVISLELEKNEEGKDALFGYIKFRDEEAEKMATSAQVSVFITPEYKDGKGNEYKGGLLRHVALTQAPVIPALQSFEISASLVSKRKGSFPMIKALAQQLGLEEISEETPDEIAFARVLSHFENMSASLAEYEKGKKPEDEEEEEESSEDSEEEEEEEEEEEDAKKKVKEALSASLLKKVTSTEVKSRKIQLDALVADGRITKAVSDGLKERFCKKESLALSFGDDGDFSDGFDSTVEALKKNERVLSFNSQTGPQGFGDNENRSKVSPMVREAERRAAAAAK